MSTYTSFTTVVQNDYGYDLEGIIVDSDGVAVDLTGCTLKLIIYEEGTTVPKVEKTAEVVAPATEGKWKYTVQLGDFNVGDKTYKVEIEIHRTTPEATVTAYDGTIHVRAEAPETT